MALKEKGVLQGNAINGSNLNKKHNPLKNWELSRILQAIANRCKMD